MKKNLFGWLAMTAMLVGTGCSTDEVVNDFSQDNAIQFGTYVGRNAVSRAKVIDIAKLAEDGFGVFAYYTNESKFNETTSTPNFMYNQKVSGKETSTGEGDAATTYSTSDWEYTPIKYWPNEVTDYLSFFAYAPYDAGANSNFTFNQEPGLPTIGFSVDETVKSQKDLLWAAPHLDLNKTAANADINDKVKFEFKHALSRIGFEVQTMIDKVNTDKESTSTSTSASNTDSDDAQPNNGTALDAANTTVVVKKVTFSGKFINSGTLSYTEVTPATDPKTYTASITGDLATTERTYTLSATSATETNFKTTTQVQKGTQEADNSYPYSQLGQSVNGTEAQLNADDSYIMIIPQDFTSENLTIEVTYDVVTEDPNLSDGVSVVENKISSTFNGVKFEAGNAYKFSLHLGLTSVKLEATVAEWVPTGDTETDYVVNVPLNIADSDATTPNP